MEIESLNSIYQENSKRYFEELCEYIKFQSVSTDPQFKPNCNACAKWLVGKLNEIGLDAQLIETSGNPVVFAEYEGKEGRPTALFYGHYDVQPAGPLEEWSSPPFEPEERNGRLYGRGSADNKAQNWYMIKALEEMIKHNALDCSVKIILEGEEESGSVGLAEFVASNGEMLKADLLMVSDIGMVPAGNPTITMGLRGSAKLNARLTGLPADVHSGIHGGAIKNPAIELSRMIAALHDKSGRVLVPGFYNDVREPSAEVKQLAETGSPTAEQYQQLMGVPANGGEQGYSLAARVGYRPTLDVVGMFSGYTGAGTMSIIPAYAEVKLSVRLVPDQDPVEVVDALESHLLSMVPEGMKLSFLMRESSSTALSVDPASKYVKKAEQVLAQLSDLDTAYRWEGGSIPIVKRMAEKAHAEPIMVGWGTVHDNWHGPDESFIVDNFRLGFLYSALYLSAL